MRRVAALFVLFVLIALASGCATGATGSGVAVNVDMPNGSGNVTGVKQPITLTPLGRPSGTLALVMVTDGHARTLWRASFHSLASSGTCVVTRTPETDSAPATISTRVRLPGQGPQAPGKAVVPRHEYIGNAEATSGPLTVQPGSGEQVVWLHAFNGGQNDGGLLSGLGSVSKVVTASSSDPIARIYCLTVQVAGA